MHPVARVLGILVVFLIALSSWMILGGVTTARTTSQDSSLRGSVAELWGAAQTQHAPTFTQEWLERVENVETFTDAHGEETKKVTPAWVTRTLAASPAQSRLDVALGLDERRKGLMWFPLYNVTFDGSWVYTHDDVPGRTLRVRFAFPDPSGQYDDFTFQVDGVDVSRQLTSREGASEYVLRVEPHQTVALAIHYRSRGMTSWSYAPTDGVGQIENFDLRLHTDFSAIDYPAQTLSPTARTARADGPGWDLAWTFTRMVTGQGIGMVMPTHIQPGELASDLSFSAPIPLALFFLWIFVLGLLRGTHIHPINYLLLAAAFFAFNLLFAYTADRLPVEAAFALASVVSVVLVVSYLRLVVGPRFAFLEAGLAQVVYQVGFGLAHFSEGYTGLTITVLGILTLFALMQLTGRIRWAEAMASRPPAAS